MLRTFRCSTLWRPSRDDVVPSALGMLPSSDSRKLSAADWSSNVRGYQQAICDTSESTGVSTYQWISSRNLDAASQSQSRMETLQSDIVRLEDNYYPLRRLPISESVQALRPRKVHLSTV